MYSDDQAGEETRTRHSVWLKLCDGPKNLSDFLAQRVVLDVPQMS